MHRYGIGYDLLELRCKNICYSTQILSGISTFYSTQFTFCLYTQQHILDTFLKHFVHLCKSSLSIWGTRYLRFLNPVWGINIFYDDRSSFCLFASLFSLGLLFLLYLWGGWQRRKLLLTIAVWNWGKIRLWQCWLWEKLRSVPTL